ncbi:uncharacterized protein LOC133824962 [Humulus lupulus]|uniref:uncharacterized protein LOC133824962 n=1 Tax=Humulus lupulus TaxID=3486 RepID=UPI002B403DF9|nr:uncharacterized protein LOC133824962 [Humulus lupulus]
MSNDRKHLWKDIGLISQGTKILWIVGGDFNFILSTEERLDYRGNGTEMVPFQTCVCECGLEDVKYNGSYFTWNNKQEGKARVCAKLDRVLANNAWLDTFPTAEVSFLAEGMFDHSPGLLSIYPNMHDNQKPFRYFNYWSSLKDFTGIVQNGWSENVEGYPMYLFVKKLRLLKQGLRRLHEQEKGDLGIQDSEAYKALLDIHVALREKPGNGELITQETQARNKFAEIHMKYPIFLRQKAKVKWLAFGDDNSKKFHASMKQRRMQNTIYSVRNSNGDWVTEQSEVIRAFLDFYDNLLGSKMSSRTRGQYSSRGFAGKILKEINAISITLTPKMVCLVSVSDYSPIACCNVVYKVATKLFVLAFEVFFLALYPPIRVDLFKEGK